MISSNGTSHRHKTSLADSMQLYLKGKDKNSNTARELF